MRMLIYSRIFSNMLYLPAIHLNGGMQLLGPVYMDWGTPVWWGKFLLFCVPQSVKTKETNPTRPGSPTPCKQALKRYSTTSPSLVLFMTCARAPVTVTTGFTCMRMLHGPQVATAAPTQIV